MLGLGSGRKKKKKKKKQEEERGGLTATLRICDGTALHTGRGRRRRRGRRETGLCGGSDGVRR